MSVSRPPWPGYLRETALIVNSQSKEREALQRFFAEANYHVLTSSTNEEAMELCRNYTGAIHVLVADDDKAECSGWTLAEAAAKVRPGLLVLFLSAESLKNNSSPAIPKKPASSASPDVFTPGMLTGITHMLTHRSQTQKCRN
jgi:DNA-binding NtrC family response regulator